MSNDVLIVSISGIRGIFGRGLDPAVLVQYVGAFGAWCRQRAEAAGKPPQVVVGRDGRVTGELCSRIVIGTLQSTGCHVIHTGLATTPTVEMAVDGSGAAGGIILSASHNPAEWNALKLLNEKGEFLSPEEANEVIALAASGERFTVPYDRIGAVEERDFLAYHIAQITHLDFMDTACIAACDFRVVVDGINSVGAFALPQLLEAIGVRPEQIIVLNSDVTGLFAHPAEPLPQNLTETIAEVANQDADLGLVVDPDADRLALIANGGVYVSEELTQVLAADFLWRTRTGPFVTNLSSSRAIEDVAARYGQQVHRSAVGEINVVKRMQAVGAMLGGEGNGGVILPDLHYGRDALAGAAMILQHLANENLSLADWRAQMPNYVISKNKLPLGDLNPDAVLAALAEKHQHERISTIDGVKIDLYEGWVHLRKSNTEPIVRIYAEAQTQDAADKLAQRFIDELQALSE